MKAMVYTAHGGPEVIEAREVPEPAVGPNDVLVRVRAVALNHLDLWLRRGLPRLRLTFPHIAGADASGVVVRTGSAVRTVEEGQEVVIAPGISCGVCPACLAGEDNLCPRYSILGEHRPGALAEFVAVPEANILPKPPGLTFEEAAAVPLVFLTAWNMLVTNARVGFTDTVLLWGAGSGVGSAGLQIVKWFGARVIAVVGAAWKVERARQLGADEVIDHRRQDVLEEVRRLTAGRGVEVVFDHVGAATWETSIRALARGGRLVTCGATSGAEATTDIRYLFGRRLTIFGTWMGTKRELHQVMALVAQGRLRPVVHTVLPWEELARAEEILERAEQFGKVVLRLAT
ncbi:MAG: zinc-binding dehydrogenase [Armatimonadota bacterium]|nr:zinc-binding dehydrogenase [Armatimonadota bacterium]